MGRIENDGVQRRVIHQVQPKLLIYKIIRKLFRKIADN